MNKLKTIKRLLAGVIERIEDGEELRDRHVAALKKASLLADELINESEAAQAGKPVAKKSPKKPPEENATPPEVKTFLGIPLD